MQSSSIRLSTRALVVLLLLPSAATTDVQPGPVAARGFRLAPRATASMAFLFAGTARPATERARGWESQRLWSTRHVDWEPVVAADRRRDTVFQMATRFGADDCAGCPDPVIVFRSSADGGATWSADRYPFRGGRTQADPQLAVADDGTLFAAYLQDFRPGVMLARSVDGGRTWSAPAQVTGDRAPRWSDHPLLVVSPDGRRVYVGLNASDSYVAASGDGGRTFAPPVRTNRDGRYWFHTGGAVLADGTVLIAAVDYSQSYRGPVDINVLRSADGGATWSKRRIDRSAESPDCPEVEGCYLGFLGPQAALGRSPSGSLLLVYNAGREAGAPQTLWYRSSADGLHWSRRRRVVHSAGGASHAFPVVLGGPGPEEFRVLWQDDRRGAWNTWFRRTRDGGMSWEQAARLSARGAEAPYKVDGGYAFPYGDYFGAATDGAGRTHVVWGAGESWGGRGGAWFTRGSPDS